MSSSISELVQRRDNLQKILDSGVIQVNSGQGRTLTYADRQTLQVQLDDIKRRIEGQDPSVRGRASRIRYVTLGYRKGY